MKNRENKDNKEYKENKDKGTRYLFERNKRK